MFTRYIKNISGAAGDTGIVYLPRLWKPDGSKPAVLICGGTDDPWSVGFSEAHVLPVARALTDAGYAVGWADYGYNQYGNQNAQNRIAALRTYMQSASIGAKVGKIGIAGFSMGGVNALNYAGNNPQNVAAITGWCPLVDMQLASQSSSIKPYLDAAYPGGWTQASNGSTTNPMTMAAAGKYNGISIQLLYSGDDAVIPASSLTNFATIAATSGTASVAVVNVGTYGHSWQAASNPQSLKAFIDQLSSVTI